MRITVRGVAAALALIAALALSPAASQAGIFRDTMEKMGIVTKPDPAKSGAAPVFPRQGFACCDLHYDGDWISDGNYAQYPMIAAGTPIEVLSYGRHRAYVKIDGKPMRLGHDYGRNEETLDAWVNKIVVGSDPRARIASYSPSVQAAIGEGKVMIGMTREQAIFALGYPLTNENGPVEGPLWHMWRSSRGEYQVNFGPDGRVKSVTGEDDVTSQMIYRPKR